MSKKIGFIGVGNMGSAIIRGLASRDVELHGIDPSAEKLQVLTKECGLISHASALDLTKACDVVVVAVKPQYAEQVVKEIATELDGSKCLVSICAGITVAMFKDWTEGLCPVVRVMPNTPALVAEGVFAVCLDDKDLSDDMKTLIPELFKGIGQVHVLPEKLFDAFTGVIGSGPAYVFYFMEALIESGVALGLSRPQATEMVKGLRAICQSRSCARWSPPRAGPPSAPSSTSTARQCAATSSTAFSSRICAALNSATNS